MRLTESTLLQVRDVNVQLTRKTIKSLRIMVSAPDGQVRVSAPWSMTDRAIHAAVLARLAWIKNHQQHFLSQKSHTALEYRSGEIHRYLGRDYPLQVYPTTSRSRIEWHEALGINLFCRPGAAIFEREAVLLAWHRQTLKSRIPGMIAHYEPILGVQVAAWGVKRMKTRWGTCNIGARRIWLGLELARYPQICLEYVVVHEMAHLLERLHNERFKRILDGAMPGWREVKNQLRAGYLR
ncbi:metal-dependent hydrolase [Acidithiobacillus marinus]|uniref:Metal-dependent hydrolase n=1 Tax=Acidithiobacillus marinus TaxID=187490 RepID=A0A2I1DP70_9PROT|nr:SprT family zinc-dependent metalloprotease [Acidithiobacillus marinus]PKY11649.1 metal-dependent hydrolase [Acidithiobacillus marinus]